MYLVMMTLQSGYFGVIFECSKPYKKSVFSVSILSVKVKIVDERKTKKNKEQLIKKTSLLMFICKIWLKSETINKLVC